MARPNKLDIVPEGTKKDTIIVSNLSQKSIDNAGLIDLCVSGS